MNTIPDFMIKNKQLYQQQARAFQDIFGVRLWNYWDMVTGLDIVKFDREVVMSGPCQMKEAVRTKFGEAAVQLLEKLI